MKFGKIDYINLLPFHIFIKKYSIHSSLKLYISKKSTYPSALNTSFLYKRIDAGFISSLAGMKSRKLNIGIVAKTEVLSVLLLKGKDEADYQSASSNALSRVLGLKGKVLIGDKALKYYFDNKNSDDMEDLAQLWCGKTGLPFVFGLLCVNKYFSMYEKMANSFAKQRVKIPYYMLDFYSKTREVKKSDVKFYLNKISYNIDCKAKTGLNRFYREVRLKNIKIPSRF